MGNCTATNKVANLLSLLLTMILGNAPQIISKGISPCIWCGDID